MLINALPDYGVTGTRNTKVVLQENPDLHAPNFQGIGGAGSGYFAVDGVLFGQRSTNYHQILDPTGLTAALQLGNPADPTNYYNNTVHTFRTRALATVATLSLAAGMALPGVKASSPTIGVGYATGAGGAVTQATSKATGVTLNAASGAITLNAAALAAATIVSFVLTDSAIAATDVLILNHISGGTPGSYSLNARCGAGSATIDVRNNTAGSLSEAIVIQFALIKGVNS